VVLPDRHQLHAGDLDIEAPAEVGIGAGPKKVRVIRIKLIVKLVMFIHFRREGPCVNQVSRCFHGVGGENLLIVSLV